MVNIEIVEIVFYSFATIAILAALNMIFLRNSVHAVLNLILVFFSTGSIWLVLQAEFLALALILVYVGAVMVLFLFLIMMLDVELSALKNKFVHYLPLALLMSVIVTSGIVYSIISSPTITSKNTMRGIELPELANLIYNDYVLAFETAGILLLVGIVAAIGLAFRGKRSRLNQDPSEQIQVTAKDRIRLID